MLKQKLIKNRICNLLLIDDFNNVIFDAHSLRLEDLIDFAELEKYRHSHFWEIDDGTFA